ncbi:HNH endonuclease [Micromonosporaceae bacterium Da 78-11]
MACAKRRAQLKRSLSARDGRSCFYCGIGFADLTDATIDHLIPQSVLPGWRQFNLVLACRPCNNRKGDTLPQVFLRQAAAVQTRRAASRRSRSTGPTPGRPRALLALAA